MKIKDDIATIKKQIAIQGSAVEKLDPKDAKLRADIAESFNFINQSINKAFANNPGLSKPIRIINPASIDKFDDPILGYNPRLSNSQQEVIYKENLNSTYFIFGLCILIYFFSILITLWHAKRLNRKKLIWLQIALWLPLISIIWIFSLQTSKEFTNARN